MARRSNPRWGRALVTGASAGIGATLARHLAADGVHLVLVARDRSRLEDLAQRCRDDHGVEIEVLAVDLADDEQIAHVEERLRVEPRIDLLVNNAGLGAFGTFHELSLAGELRQIDVNVRAPVRLAHAALAAMTAAGSGAIVNISSTLALQPMPGGATYAATKAFVTSFSEALHEEARGTGVTVTAVMPGLVKTEFHGRAGKAAEFGGLPSFLWLSPEAVAKSALRAAARGRALAVPGLGYKLGAAMTSASPRGVVRRVSRTAAARFR